MSDQKQVEQQQAEEIEHIASAASDDTVDGEWQPGEGVKDQAIPTPSTADILAPMLQISFGLIAAKRGAHWALSDEEATEAGRAYGEVMDKHFPEVTVGPEITAIMVTLAIVGPRAMQDKTIAAAKPQTKDQEEGGDGGDKSE